METTIRIIVENSVPPTVGLLGEHGLSMLIDHNGKLLLFDTGQGQHTMIHNLRLLGVPLPRISGVVLSHGHFDHTGGLFELLRENPNTKVYCHPDAFEHRYAVRDTSRGSALHEIGIPHSFEALQSLNARILDCAEFMSIDEGIYCSGTVQRPDKWKPRDKRLVVYEGDRIVPDPFHDDMSMVIETKSGPILLLGCAHAGLDAIFSHMREKGGWDKYYAVIGGTHLMAAESEAEYSQAVELFKTYGVQLLVPCHCTGQKATRYLVEAFDDRCVPGHVGLELKF